ncbi:MoaD/ThiS family protein [Paenibacillus solani]|uniref:MoaD/ThiS family protein n=1 Tax=Paenibacillus solani TaxID=1705565 RepID=UPI0009EC5D71
MVYCSPQELRSDAVFDSHSILLFRINRTIGTASLHSTYLLSHLRWRIKSLLSKAYPHTSPRLPTVFVTVNQNYALSARLIQHGDEVALFPPVSGDYLTAMQNSRLLPALH